MLGYVLDYIDSGYSTLAGFYDNGNETFSKTRKYLRRISGC